MKKLALLLAASAFAASPAIAQHAGHSMPGMTMPMPAKPAPKKKAATKKQPAKKASAKKPPTKKAAAGKARAKAPAAGHHDRHGTSQMPGTAAPKSETGKAAMPAGHDMSQMPGMEAPETQMPPGHDMSRMPGMTMPAGEHGGHQMGTAEAAEPPVAPPPAEALQGPENAADAVYGTAAMGPARTVHLFQEHGATKVAKLLVDQLETRVRSGRDGYFMNAQAWYGGDIDKLWLKTEIEGAYGKSPDQVEVQALWSHAIDPWFNLQTGVRLDTQPGTRGRLVLGIEGLAPYWWEVGASAFVSDKGDVTARAEAEHDVRITQKLILQPRAQLDFSLQDVPREHVGAGLSSVELGARLRYQIVPNFAPYIGIVYERAIGRSARFLRADGESPGGFQFAVGLRTWF